MLFSASSLVALSAASLAFASPVERRAAPTFESLQAQCADSSVYAAISYQDGSSSTAKLGACLPYTNVAGSPYASIVGCKAATCAISSDHACANGNTGLVLPIIPSYSEQYNLAQMTLTASGGGSANCTASNLGRRQTSAPTFESLKAACEADSSLIVAASYKDGSTQTASFGTCLPLDNTDIIVACKAADCSLSNDSACGAGQAGNVLPIVPTGSAFNLAQMTLTSFGAGSASCTV